MYFKYDLRDEFQSAETVESAIFGLGKLISLKYNRTFSCNLLRKRIFLHGAKRAIPEIFHDHYKALPSNAACSSGYTFKTRCCRVWRLRHRCIFNRNINSEKDSTVTALLLYKDQMSKIINVMNFDSSYKYVFICLPHLFPCAKCILEHQNEKVFIIAINTHAQTGIFLLNYISHTWGI